MKFQLDTNFVYDPQRQGFGTNLWKLITGSAPTVVSNKLRVTAATILHYSDIFRGYFNFVLNVPDTPTNALLTGGTGATAVAATYAAVTDGEFTISLEGTAYDITAIDFTGVTTMAGVAAKIQAAIIAQTGLSFITVVWSTNKFIITSRISISVLSAVSGGSGTDISGAGATAFMDSDTGNGTVTAATNSNKKFGLIQLSKNLRCYFHLRGAVLVCVTSNDNGDVKETEITWVTAWTAHDIKYEIDATRREVKFKINENQVAYHETYCPEGVMSLYIENLLADNFDLSYIEARDIETNI